MNHLLHIRDNLKLSINAYVPAHKLILGKSILEVLHHYGIYLYIIFMPTFSPAMMYSQSIVNWIFTFIPNSSEIKLIGFLISILYLLVSIAIRLLIFLIYFSLFRNFIMILLIPLIANIAKKSY